MDLCGLFRALGDPLRFRIVEALAEQPKTVTAIVEQLGAPQPNVSRHLKSLREGGVIRRRRRGKWIEYSIDAEAIASLGEWLASAASGSRRHAPPAAAPADRPGRDDAVLFGG